MPSGDRRESKEGTKVQRGGEKTLSLHLDLHRGANVTALLGMEESERVEKLLKVQPEKNENVAEDYEMC